jgi:hypothetical protein
MKKVDVNGPITDAFQRFQLIANNFVWQVLKFLETDLLINDGICQFPCVNNLLPAEVTVA